LCNGCWTLDSENIINNYNGTDICSFGNMTDDDFDDDYYAVNYTGDDDGYNSPPTFQENFCNLGTSLSPSTVPSTVPSVNPSTMRSVFPSSLSPSSESNPSSVSALSTGELAGVVIGSVAGAALIGSIAVYIIMSMRSTSAPLPSSKDAEMQGL